MSWVDDLIKNTQNAIDDAKKLGLTLAAPTSAPVQPPRTYPVTVAGMSTSTMLLIGGALVLVLLWKKG